MTVDRQVTDDSGHLSIVTVRAQSTVNYGCAVLQYKRGQQQGMVFVVDLGLQASRR